MRLTVGLLALMTTGCAAHSGLMRDGDRAARMGAWDVAVSSYEAAARVSPDNLRVQEKLDSARSSREQARALALERAATAVARGLAQRDYEAVREAIAAARRVDPLEASLLGDEAVRSLAPLAREALAGQRLREAAELGMVSTWLAPENTQATTLWSRARTAMTDHIETLAHGGSWEAAVGEALWLGELDSSYPARERVTELRADWASQLATRAKLAEAEGELGRAALSFHEAFGVDGDASWRAERDRVARQVSDSLRYSVRWVPEQGARTAATRQQVIEQLRGDRRLSVVSEGRALAQADLDLDEARCEETGSERLESVDLLVGQRQVTNPAYEPAMLELRTAERERDRAALAEERAEEAVLAAQQVLGTVLDHELPAARTRAERAEDELVWAERRHSEASSALATAEAANAAVLTAHSESLTQLITAEGEAERSLARARRALELAQSSEPVDPEQVERLETQRRRARRALREATEARQTAEATGPALPHGEPELVALRGASERSASELATATRQVEAPRAALAAAEASMKRASGALEDARSHLSGRRDALEQALDAVVTRASRVDRTPMTLSEDVYEPFAYVVQDWERTCSTTATLRLWEDGKPVVRSLTVAETTRDSWNAAHPEAGIAPDPLYFPDTDPELRQRAADQLAEQLASEFSASAHDYYARLWNGALTADPDGALDAWLAVLRLDPTVADETGLATLRSRTGQSDLAWMRG